MVEKKEKKGQERWIQLLLGPAVGALVLLFSLTNAYERAELVTYDWRFNLRNSLFGPPAMDPRLGTIEIDDQSVEAEGRYQDWTRDKYIDAVRLLGAYGAEMIGFDMYFIEPSARFVAAEQILGLERLDRRAVEALFERADYDERFRDAIAAAGNVYLAQYLVVGDEGAPPETAQRSAEQEEALEAIRRRAPRLVGGVQASTLRRATYFEPPLKLLREAARGFAYAQTAADVDGARRRYPLVYQYEDLLFPSIALMMVCDHLQVPMEKVEVRPGKYIRLPGAHLDEGRVKDIEIPIDACGDMNVNWAGRWEDTFVRYPHITLRRATRRQQRQQRLEKIKALVAADPALRRNPRALPAALAEAGFADLKVNQQAVLTWLQASGIEELLRKNPQLDAGEFWKLKGVDDPRPEQLEMVNNIRRNNRIAELLRENPAASFGQVRQALAAEDPERLEQSFHFVRRLAPQGRLPLGARPLYFYPYVGVEGHPIAPEELQGKILFYGLTATGSTDLSVTPFQGDYPMVGIYSNVFNTILQENFIRRIPPWADALLIVALGVLLSLVVPRLKVLQGAALVAALVAVYALLAFFSFTHFGYWLEVAAPMLGLVSGYLGLTIYGYVIKEKEKEFVQGAFGHYLSPAVVEEIMNNPGMINQLGGEERLMTAFFSDIANFSTISECLAPAALVNFINDYLSEMCDIIEHYGGTIDKFEGDAIVAFFGAPFPYEDHARRACLACIDQQKKLVELRRRWQESGELPERLRQLRRRWETQGRTFAHVRMGLSSGPMVVGNMGSKTRSDYTMMGDTVNLASRFESGQKIYGTGIMINDVAYEQVKDLVETRKLDLIQVVGKEEPVIAYEVLDRKGALSAEQYRVLELYNQGMAAYEAFDFVAAQRFFEAALEIDPGDGPSALYADRCEDYAAEAPEDLVFRAQVK